MEARHKLMYIRNLNPIRLLECKYLKSLLNNINRLRLFIAMKRFSGISLRKFWDRYKSESFVRLRKAFGWIFWILFAARSRIMRFFKFFRCLSLMCIMKFFFKYKCWRWAKLSNASDAILTAKYRGENINEGMQC